MPDTRVGHCLGPEENGVSSGEGGEGGPGPPKKEGNKQSTPQRERRQHGAGGRRKDESGVTKRNQHAQSEHLQKAFNSVFKCSLMMLKIHVVFVSGE